MLNAVWILLLVVSTIIALLTGNTKEMIAGAMDGATSAFKLALGLTGVMCLWLGIMRIAEDSGIVAKIVKLISPLLRLLFPRIPSDHPALGSMAMNITANMFGLNNAATPLGIKAMQDLDSLNTRKGTATDEMCMFLAINTSSIQIIPAGAIAMLAAAGAIEPAVIVLPALISTTVSTFAGISSALILSRMQRFVFDSGKGKDTAK